MVKVCDLCELTFIHNLELREVVVIGYTFIPKDATSVSVKSYFDAASCPRCLNKLREVSRDVSFWRY